MKGPGLFSDIGKKAKDLLTRDYSYDQKITISTSSASGVLLSDFLMFLEVGVAWHTCAMGLTSGAVKKGGLYALDVATQYKYKNTIIDVKADTDSNISATFTVLEILPFTKTIATVKFPEYNSGKLEVQYFHDHAGLATVVALKQNPVVDLSAAVGAHGIVFGAEAGFDTYSGVFTKYTAGIGLKRPDYDVSIILAEKGDLLRASYVYHLDEKQKSSTVAEITRRFSTNENTFTVGGACALDPQTTVKARLNNSGKLGALLQHEVKPRSFLTLSGEFETKALDKNPKFGLALALKP
ncbi:Mitochondrial outer membrane protein porin 5 [Apostasia shenzhenica]|uniref:Mitochondrial outer membrane protein porin 5 n=1 Tax=Apostasia shenzhenica TaxID=1088818 RepID=A0A2I0AWJ4_9ASPA|nr:Mitochondrial outer membrane protein porin 5 [Apostasia shenzhenica]